VFSVCYATSSDCGDDGNLDRLDYLTQSDCCTNGGDSFSDAMGTCVVCPAGMTIYFSYI